MCFSSSNATPSSSPVQMALEKFTLPAIASRAPQSAVVTIEFEFAFAFRCDEEKADGASTIRRDDEDQDAAADSVDSNSDEADQDQVQADTDCPASGTPGRSLHLDFELSDPPSPKRLFTPYHGQLAALRFLVTLHTLVSSRWKSSKCQW